MVAGERLTDRAGALQIPQLGGRLVDAAAQGDLTAVGHGGDRERGDRPFMAAQFAHRLLVSSRFSGSTRSSSALMVETSTAHGSARGEQV